MTEVTPGEIHKGWPWGILCGIEEEAKLFEGCPVDVYAMPEGSVFYHTDHKGVREPVMSVEGVHGEFCLLETPLLGLICQPSGVAMHACKNIPRRLCIILLLLSYCKCMK